MGGSATGPEYRDIPRVNTLTKAEFKATYYTLEQPCICESFDNVRSWPAFQKWTMPEFAKAFGDIVVRPRVGFPNADNWKANLFEMPVERFPRYETMTFAELIQKVMDPATKESPIYWRTMGQEKRIKESIPAFIHSIDFQEIAPDAVAQDMNILIGSAGTRANFHQDDRHNLLVHIAGRKRVFLGSPYFTPCFYPYPGIKDKSPITPDHYEDRFPKLKDAVILVGEVGPGDVLFIPRGWWHALIALEPTIMVNQWFDRAISVEERDHMYSGLGTNYKLQKKLAFVQQFCRSSLNIMLGRSPIAGMSIWRTSGSNAAVDLFNAAAKLNPARKNSGKTDWISNPFFQ